MRLFESGSPGAESKSFDLVDFSFEADGSIMAAFTNYDLATPIYIYKVGVEELT